MNYARLKSVEDNLWNDAPAHIHEFPTRHKRDEGEYNTEDDGDDDVPRHLILNRHLQAADEGGGAAGEKAAE